MTQNEFKIVALLARNCGRVLTYDKLIEHIKRKHGLDSAAYRQQFGLMRKQARLTSPEYATKMHCYVEDKPTWKENFADVHSGKIPNGRRNPHWSKQEIELRREQQKAKVRKRWSKEVTSNV